MLVNKKTLTTSVIAVILVVGSLGYLMRKDRNLRKEIVSEKLEAHEEAAVIIEPTTGRITTIKKVNQLPGAVRGRVQSGGDVPVVVEHIDGAREVRVSIGKEGQVKVTARYRGFCFEPGFGLLYSDQAESRYELDAEVFFSRRHGAYIGLNAPIKDARRIRAHLAYGYTLPFRKLSNTTVLVGMDSRKEVVAGVRVKF